MLHFSYDRGSFVANFQLSIKGVKYRLMERVRLIVNGDVHTVGFRYSTIEIARDLGLVGWVKNNPDGTVEIVAEGPKEKLGNLIIWSKKGPPLARVEDVKVDWQGITGEFSSFDVRY